MFQDLVESILNEGFAGLDIAVKIRPSTSSKIWTVLADVYINGEKMGIYGTNDGFDKDIGYSLSSKIPGISKDTLSPDRKELEKYIRDLVKKEYNRFELEKHMSDDTKETFGSFIDVV
jgi:hypothetical protein